MLAVGAVGLSLNALWLADLGNRTYIQQACAALPVLLPSEEPADDPHPQSGFRLMDLALDSFDVYSQAPFADSHPWVDLLGGWTEASPRSVRASPRASPRGAAGGGGAVTGTGKAVLPKADGVQETTSS